MRGGWMTVVPWLLACKPEPAASTNPPSAVEAGPETEASEEAPVPEAVAQLEELRASDPNEGAARYVLARYYAGRGQRDTALELLDELLAIEAWDYPLEASDFPGLVDDPQFEALAQRAAARTPKVEHGPVAFELDVLDILPEGVAWDPTRKELLVGSMAKRQILAADAQGRTRVVVKPGEGGLWGVLGITVDAAQDRVWAASVATPIIEGYDAERDAGQAALCAFALADGAAQGCWPAPQTPSQLNDLVALADGTVLVTDSATGAVLRKAPGADPGTPLLPLVPAKTFLGPNGIADLPDPAAIVVADFHGLHRVTLADGAVQRFAPPPGVVTMGGIDGLERRGRTLVGIQNLVNTGRVWAYTLDESSTAIRSAQILDDDHPRYQGPTTGAIDGDRFLYLANASLQFSAQGIVAAPPGAHHVILELRLP